MRYFATYLIYAAVLARAVGWSQDGPPIPTPVWVMLILFGLILVVEQVLTRRLAYGPWQIWFLRAYTLVQSGLVIGMLFIAPTLDILTMLFLPLSFQAVLFFGDRVGFAWIGAFSLALCSLFLVGMEQDAGIVAVLLSTGANALTGSYAYLISRTDRARQENQRLFGNLQEAYRQLKDTAAQAEALAAAEERHQLVRELHDSLTQTLFSMNLAVQSAQIAAGDGPQQVEEHLARLQTLARSAAGEVQALTGQIPPRSVIQEGLVTAIQRLADERLAQNGLQVTIEVTGLRELPKPVALALYRIVQEAFNNIIRHAGTCQALVRIRLESPCASLEVEDAGCGFDPSSLDRSTGFGLTGMAERAGEIGWVLEVKSHSGQGTRVCVKEKAA